MKTAKAIRRKPPPVLSGTFAGVVFKGESKLNGSGFGGEIELLGRGFGGETELIGVGFGGEIKFTD